MGERVRDEDRDSLLPPLGRWNWKEEDGGVDDAANEKKRGKTRGSCVRPDSCRRVGQWGRSARAMFGLACVPIGGLDGSRGGGFDVAHCRWFPKYELFSFNRYL